LAYPDCSFHLVQEEKTALNTSGNGNRREVLSQIYGSELGKQLLEVDFSEEAVRITGFISPISQTRSNRKEITFFVNGRWVQDNTLTTALMRALPDFFDVGRYPIAILFLQLEPKRSMSMSIQPRQKYGFVTWTNVFTVAKSSAQALLAFFTGYHR